MAEFLIITLTEHALWGPILQPVLVREELSGYLTILEIVGTKSSFYSQLSNPEKEIVMITEKVSDKVLMKNYSKEKNIAEFHKRVTPETIERYILPLLESSHRKIVGHLQHLPISLYLRTGVKSRALYDTDRVIVPKTFSEVVFNFRKTDDTGLRYFISLKCQDEEFDLYAKSYYVLCSEPAVLVINHKLHCFSDIDIKKLIPFFTKKHIDVPASSEKAYIKKFVRNCVERYEVNAEGLDIHEINPQKQAVLSLDSDLNLAPVLFLNFRYGDKLYPVDSPSRKRVFTEEWDGNTTLAWFYPDKKWEKSMTEILLKAGLVKSGFNHFSLRKKSEEGSTADETATIIEWIQQNAGLLEHFEFSQKLSDKNYYIGEISINSGIETKQDWFDIHVVAIFGEFKIPFARFRNHILNNIREYVLPDDTIAILPLEWFTKYYELMLFSKKSDEKIRLKKHHFGIVDTIQGNSQPSYLAESAKRPEVPEELCAELRNYQQKGFSWLVQLFENGFGGCLADDMGLGKTLQTIAFLQYIKTLHKSTNPLHKQIPYERKITKEPTKEVVQLSIFDAIIANEATDESVDTSSDFIHPSLIVMPTSLIHNWQNELRRFAPNLKIYIYSGVKRLKSTDINKVFQFYDVVLTTYGTLRNDIELLHSCQFHHLILDESQYVKNPDSLSYKAVKQINALHKLALTGTPVENSLTDLWSQLNIVNEGLLGSFTNFKNAYINPISKNNKQKEEALLHIIQPFILRRTKDEVAPELPLLSQETVYCDMSDEQQSAYNEEKNKLRTSLLLNDTNFDPQKMAFLTLQGLTRLRLLANHPVLMDTDYTGDSGKFEQIIMRFETLKSENHKVLIFSSFVKHLRLLAGHFDKENWKYAWLSGSTAATERESEINKFMTDPDVNCFFISLKAGGVGLNLTAADYVFIIDPWWNPASEMQALSRAHRIGQDKKVMVYRFISSETIEEKIRNLQESKSKLAETFVTSSSPLKDLNREELVKLLEAT